MQLWTEEVEGTETLGIDLHTVPDGLDCGDIREVLACVARDACNFG